MSSNSESHSLAALNLQQCDVPFYKAYRKNITLLLDGDGNILDLHSVTSGDLETVFDWLVSEKNVRRIFSLPPGKSLGEAVSETREYVSPIQVLSPEEQIDNFYLNRPILHLYLAKLSGNLFLGTVMVSSGLPRLVEKRSGSLVYLDHRENIVGFSQSFYDWVKTNLDSPAALFGKAIGDFLDPTPALHQAARLKDYSPPGDREFPVLYEKEFLETPMESPGGSFWALPVEIDLWNQDFSLRFETSGGMEALPSLVLGDPGHRRPVFPDVNGYLFGPDGAAAGIQFKKFGYVAAFQPLKNPAGTGGAYRFLKTGNVFSLFRNGECIFRYFDQDPIARPPTGVMLYRRGNATHPIRRVALTARPAPPPVSQPDLMVSLKSDPERFFLASRLDSLYLTASGPLFGYRLQDISALQNRIGGLEREYLREKREREGLERELARHRPASAYIGNSKAAAALRERALRAAGNAATVLLQGPTGSGKEVLAEFIHRNSARARHPFIKLDCSLLPAALMESELFGHEKGAFTGADRTREGLLEQADGGTLFLDELNNLTPAVQAKLLQFLEEQTILRVGGREPLRLDVRVIGASNLDLKALVDRGLFRQDLYYRLAVLLIDIPALSERLDDLPALCDRFLGELNRAHGKNIRRVSPEGFRKLYGHRWPGNVRELKNVLEQAVVFCDGEEIGPEHLSLEGPKPRRKPKTPIRSAPEEIRALMREHQGQIAAAARALNVTPQALYYHLKKIRDNP